MLLINVSSVGPRRQASHGCQVAAVSSHSLNDEHSSLGAGSRLFDPVACLKREEENVEKNIESEITFSDCLVIVLWSVRVLPWL